MFGSSQLGVSLEGPDMFMLLPCLYCEQQCLSLVPAGHSGKLHGQTESYQLTSASRRELGLCSGQAALQQLRTACVKHMSLLGVPVGLLSCFRC